MSVLANLNTSHTLQASTDLVDWTTLFSFTCTNIPMVVTDLAGTNFTQRFYRVAP